MIAAAVMKLRPAGAGVITLLKIQAYEASVGGICLGRLIARSPVEPDDRRLYQQGGWSMRSIRNFFFVDKITMSATLPPGKQNVLLRFLQHVVFRFVACNIQYKERPLRAQTR